MKLKIFFLTSFLLLQIGCAKQLNQSYSYEPFEDVKVEIILTELKPHKDSNSVFLFFTCKVENRSLKTIYFNPENIKVYTNNYRNSFTYYDSLASSEAKTEKLQKGLSVFKLYFVFPDKLGTSEINQFEITDFGMFQK